MATRARGGGPLKLYTLRVEASRGAARMLVPGGSLGLLLTARSDEANGAELLVSRRAASRGSELFVPSSCETKECKWIEVSRVGRGGG